MGYIKKEKVEEVKLKADIVSVVGDYVSLTKAGGQFKGCCPFHSEKSPSFFVYPETNSYHCYGCHKHGNNISFVMEIESLDFPSTIEKLAEKFGVQLEYDNSVKSDSYDKYYEMNDFVSKFYYKNMLENTLPKSYLVDRGISQKTINNFMIGYADGNWKSLVNALREKHFDLKVALELGLIRKTNNGDFIDKFRDRIMFPIKNIYGKIIGFGGRTVVNDNAKYINSQESVIFKKGDNLYAIDKVANRNIRDKIMVVEGYMDVISLYQQGINYVVAGLGTAFTENQARLARKFAGKNVYICYDGDNAGINATNKTYAIFENISVKPHIVKMPEKLDPDDFIKKYGLKDFENLVENSLDIYDFNFEYLKSLINEEDDIKTRAEKYNNILNFLSSINSNLVKDMYIKNFSKKLDLDEQSIKNDLENFKKNVVYKKTEKNIEDISLMLDYNKIILTNTDKKTLIMGIILLMKGKEFSSNSIEMLKFLSDEAKINKIMDFILEVKNEKKIILPRTLIEHFKTDDVNLKVIEYISKLYKDFEDISVGEYSKILEITYLNFKINQLTNSIEMLRTMERDSHIEEIINTNIELLMNLNEKITKLRVKS